MLKKLLVDFSYIVIENLYGHKDVMLNYIFFIMDDLFIIFI
jgi:hypothetical protein